MKLQRITKKQTKIRLALQGPHESGKTKSALLLAHGLTGDWSKVAIIDTEQNSASLYSQLGPFNTVQIGSPYTVERFIESIELCELAGMEAIIIDSITPEWTGELGCLHQTTLLEGSSAERWIQVMARHNTFINTIQTSPAHIIATVRSAEDKVYQEKGYIHHFITALRLDHNYKAHVLKDKTGLFRNLGHIRCDEIIGARLLEWCKKGQVSVSQELQERINNCTTVEELNGLNELDLEDISMQQAYTKKRIQLEGVGYWKKQKAMNGKVVHLSSPAKGS